MKQGKDGKKVMGPLFPRLHVKDSEKGWPRAPPRNKMALYEQLSVPSQRFNLAPSYSSSQCQGGGHERSALPPFYVPFPSPAHSTEKTRPCYSNGMNFNGTREFERKSMKNESYKVSNAAVHLSENAECSSTCPQELSSSKNSSGKNSADERDFGGSSYQPSGDRGRLNPFPMHPEWSAIAMVGSPQKSVMANCSSSVQLRNSGDKSLKRTNTTDLKSRTQGRNHGVQNPIENAEINQCCSEKATSQSHTSVVEKITETSKYASLASNGKRPSASTNECNNSHTGNSWLCEETSVRLQPENNIGTDDISFEPMCLNCNEIEEKKNASRVRTESGPRTSLGKSHRHPNHAENCIEESGGKALLGNVDRNDDESETSVVGCLSVMDISPDDVVGVIGQNHFWKARRAITNQQRAFAVQVFELHRLIKVQKLLAGSPELLIEKNPYLSRPSSNVPAKKITSESRLKSQSQIIKLRDESQKMNQSTDCASEEDDSQKPSLCPHGDGVDHRLVSQNSNNGTHSGNTPSAPLAADNTSTPWCFHPHGNQWLVPVMSPSEGLIYKPYTGLGPTNVGFMTPVYGGCGPLSLPPQAAYGVPASQQQPGVGPFSGASRAAQNCFRPAYGLPFMNPMISTTPVEHVNPSSEAQPNQEETNFNMHSRSSCNLSNQKSEAFSSCAWKFQTSKDSEVQGSSASSPCERVLGAGHVAEGREGKDALPLFPVSHNMDGSDLAPQFGSVDQQTRVIKVVPHNPRSATESAARIFRSIQKEREQFDSV
ncbi:hypothetical protein MRB53_006720 [Persea americana]|uniref:Uncharacterized protein n=1 Tax=Persea americana TaxID=3435 RepID=A0ACC2MIK5_PERAE|nr:hypothetical protein MRB53_006720 [Persea americana]|eukprot:TRINITY_DN43998_c1_g4_i1.p1 TRINITY_DN43998_c1_g4~~TRINITY_DN43998_c1_g4_i1.p1  ORF type:complete len:770 (-),score=164.49 TRINITY_DN43998_c1_g4_i1:411-2720(-)